MSLKIVPVIGWKKSACRNDAYSIVENRKGREVPRVLDIIPAEEIGDHLHLLKAAFEAAIKKVGTDDYIRIRKEARRELRRSGVPVSPV